MQAEHSPGLLRGSEGPLGAALVSSGVVSTLKRVQVADDWIGDHDDEG